MAGVLFPAGQDSFSSPQLPGRLWGVSWPGYFLVTRVSDGNTTSSHPQQSVSCATILSTRRHDNLGEQQTSFLSRLDHEWKVVSFFKAERERERDGTDRWRVDSKTKSSGEVRETLFSDGGERASFLEGSQATPARLSGRNNVKVKTLWW
jgi:hypothetical protein